MHIGNFPLKAVKIAIPDVDLKHVRMTIYFEKSICHCKIKHTCGIRS